jgi:hypothetical protein
MMWQRPTCVVDAALRARRMQPSIATAAAASVCVRWLCARTHMHDCCCISYFFPGKGVACLWWRLCSGFQQWRRSLTRGLLGHKGDEMPKSVMRQ